ncbi:MAG: DUF4097 family beta strand repeat-containing protein [Clostridia bacterium]|nr:DUF4097 family beta strand repeat-containing protein [Clostridia bacterium]
MIGNKLRAVVVIAVALVAAFAFSGCIVIGDWGFGWQREDLSGYALGDAEITERVDEISIEWTAGIVELASWDGAVVKFTEAAAMPLEDEYRLRYNVEGSRLNIWFMSSTKLNINLSKTLTVYVPQDWSLEELDVSTASAQVGVSGLSVGDLDFESASGDLRVADSIVSGDVEIGVASGSITVGLIGESDEFRVNSVSGDVMLDAQYVRLVDVSTVSGDVELSAERASQRCDVETVSGGVRIALPDDCSLELTFDTISGSFSSELEHADDRDSYVFGAGGYEYRVYTVSGFLAIKRR